MHLDKVYTLPLAGDAALASYTSDAMGEAMRSIVRDASAVKQHYDRSWIVPNVRRALDEAVLNGVLHVQAFVDVDTTAGLEGMASVLEVREEYRDLVDLQVVAFPQDGLLRDPGAAELCEEAHAAGRRRGRWHPVDRAHRPRRCRARAVGMPARRHHRFAGRDAHRRRGRSRAAHHRDAGRGDDRARAARPGRGLPCAGPGDVPDAVGRPARRPGAGRGARVRVGPAHRAAAPAGAAVPRRRPPGRPRARTTSRTRTTRSAATTCSRSRSWRRTCSGSCRAPTSSGSSTW